MHRIIEIYDRLLDAYGYQGWWPVTPIGCRGNDGMPIYGVKLPSFKQRFEICVGAILTQNTAWTNVEKALLNLNKEGLIDRKKLLAIDKARLARLIQPSGYFNQKADRLKIIAQFFTDHPIEHLMKEDMQEVRQLLLGVKGIGPETADSILLYALDKPIFVIDAYTQRIFSRVGYDEDGYDRWQSLFMNVLVPSSKTFSEYHALIVEHAKQHCGARPDCDSCPLDGLCKKHLNNAVHKKSSL